MQHEFQDGDHALKGISDLFIKVSSLCKVVLQEAETAKCDLSDWLPSYPKHWGGVQVMLL